MVLTGNLKKFLAVDNACVDGVDELVDEPGEASK